MTMIEIKKGVPIPARKQVKVELIPYHDVIKSLKVGDSFDVNVKELGLGLNAARTSLLNRAKRLGMTATSRTDVKGILTIWRVS